MVDSSWAKPVDIHDDYANLVRRAMRFAALMHKNQEYDNHPFIVHLYHTAEVARRVDLPPAIEAAAWLHDILEDTTLVYHDIKVKFGEEVAELVYAVTDEVGRNRKERKEKTYPKIIEYGSEAVALKLCDTIANVETAIKNRPLDMPNVIKNRPLHNDKKYTMYKKEYFNLREALKDKTQPRYYRDTCGRINHHTTTVTTAIGQLWSYLDSLLGGDNE